MQRNVLRAIALCAGAVISSNAYSLTLIENVEVTDSKTTIAINGYTDPVVFASVPTLNDSEPGVVSISNVTDSSFDVQFKEWPYLDGVHGAEYVSFLVVEKGRHQLQDGSIWEAGEFTLKSGTTHQFFNESFVHAPHILLNGQTQNRADAYALRVSSLSKLTFGASLDVQESGSVHAEESIGYLAVYKDNNNGITNENLAYNLTQQAINQEGFQTISGKLLVQEEQSKDAETAHWLEAVAILNLKNQLFAQDITHYGKDTMALRLETSSTFGVEPGETTGQYGNIALVGSNGLTESSYTTSHSYSLDSASGAFDGYNLSTLVNTDATYGKIKRGVWLTTVAQEHWLQVAFEKRAYISAFRVMVHKSAADLGMGVKDVTLQVSDDNINFIDHESFSLARSYDQTVELTQPAIGKYVRLKIHNTHGHNYRVLSELEYYGGFVTSGGPVTPPEEPEPVNGITCASILQQNANASSGTYLIDPDGDGGIAPFYAHCDMTTNGGGWTLVAHHTDGLETIVHTSPVTQAEVGVLPNEQWQAVRNNMTEGMMFIDEHAKVSQISKSKLYNANCIAVKQNNDLTQPLVSYDTAALWHHEGTGCSLSGLDYSLIIMSVKSTTRGDSYLRNGASLYQHSVRFDVWPYNHEVYSGSEQDTLFYYVK
ncbi:discoidin domain-containing protein [Pseudoalteromonas byunsanensis]|uniref:Fibrinogen C-terminal domain-containing protein n=1 Tax=Pseudoalteromonas byunsanensis TaxID=327939 RepID=A0A1S1N3W5_9GAMM|nr:discoidin domain-containing protein [Pseudoalteromonas byunsanensis]OHU94023.1 hypothetical protein BIW53_17540 [Pseudoalteromonas byunsanensis]